MKDKTIRMQRKNGINLHKERFRNFHSRFRHDLCNFRKEKRGLSLKIKALTFTAPFKIYNPCMNNITCREKGTVD